MPTRTAFRIPSRIPSRIALFTAAFLTLTCLGNVQAAVCPEAGHWQRPGEPSRSLSQKDLLDWIGARRVVLLGEEHDDAQHHAWQLHMLAALHARNPDMAIGFEGFPRRVQPVLNRWVGGELGEAEFLKVVEWDRIWGLDAQLYLPLFHFARMHRIPLIALNVERTLVNRAGRAGWASIPAAEREGVGDPAPAPREYLEQLLPAYASHGKDDARADLDDPAFRNFVDGMLVWDRAMAEAVAGALASTSARQVVGIVGRGHVEHGRGIARQLRDLGVTDIAALVPWNLGPDCAAPPAGIADGVFGMQAKAMQPSGPRLGVELATPESGHGARVHRVLPDSVAAAAGLREEDIIEQAAGQKVLDVQSVIAVVRRQAPGTWLPLIVRRGGGTQELVARFPARP